MNGLLELATLPFLLISVILLVLGLTMEWFAGPYSAGGVGTWTAFFGVLGTGWFGGIFAGMLTSGSRA